MFPSIHLGVEDDLSQRELLSDFLRQEGIDVVSCESAEDAQLTIARIGADLSLAITDFRLSNEETGIDVANFAKAKFLHLQFVLVSSEGDLKVPADVRFLRKPFPLREVLNIGSPAN